MARRVERARRVLKKDAVCCDRPCDAEIDHVRRVAVGQSPLTI